jgi:hypothetical protein
LLRTIYLLGKRPKHQTNNWDPLPPHLHRDLLRRLNPKHTTQHLQSLITLAPDLTEDLLSSVDQPLTIRRCKQTGRDYLLCDYNRDGDSYRSPWSNEFDPPLDGGVTGDGGAGDGAGAAGVPSDKVRRMEVKANEAFDVYRELYYEGGVSSVYFWNLDDGFAGVVLLKKGKRRPKKTLPKFLFYAMAQRRGESSGGLVVMWSKANRIRSSSSSIIRRDC